MSLVHVSIFCEFLLSQYTIFAMKRRVLNAKHSSVLADRKQQKE